MTSVREATHTVAFIDEYCAHYRSVFHNVRHFEQFTQLELGIWSETKRKSLPRLAKTVQGDPQALHHFLANADWSVEELRAIRLGSLRQAVAGRPFICALTRQEIARKARPPTMWRTNTSARAASGRATASSPSTPMGCSSTSPFPLAFATLQTQGRLKPGDGYQTKPQMAVDLVQAVQAQGFRFSVVLADSLYGESMTLLAALQRLGLSYVVAIRSNHHVWMLRPDERMR